MASDRMQSFKAFWPYYLGEHLLPACRITHFIGTTGWFAMVAFGLYAFPVKMGIFLAAKVLIMALGTLFFEKRFNAGLLMIGVVLTGAFFLPTVILPGVVWAYGWAWVGHFRIEHNRPATFTYPIWSLLGDYRMWTRMARGQLWTGVPAEAPVRTDANLAEAEAA